MEKYGVQDEDLVAGLRDEEHDLMLVVSGHMSGGEKNASEERNFQQAQSRLQTVRDRITEHEDRKSVV